MQTKVTTQIILDQRSAKKGQIYPVKLRITFQRKQKYYSTNRDLTEEDFTKVNSTKPRGDYKTLKLFFDEIELRAKKIIEEIRVFTFESFERKFYEDFQSVATKKNLLELLENKIEILRDTKRISSSKLYENLKNSLLNFQKKITFNDITVEWLKRYETYMLEERKTSKTTVGIYLRNLRAIYNEAIQADIIPLESYPFGRRKYQIPSGVNTKKAINISDIERIYHYETDNEMEKWAKDMWVFSYLCNGMNIKDIARLRYKDIQGENIYFRRAKTENTNRNQKAIICALTPEIQGIIQKWGNKPVLNESLIFPIITEGITPEKELAVKNQAIKQINKYMKRIAENLGIDAKLTTYSARHSYATVLKRSGVSTEFISESLGHTSTKTTQSYLDSFEDETRKEIAKKLISF